MLHYLHKILKVISIDDRTINIEKTSTSTLPAGVVSVPNPERLDFLVARQSV